MWRWKRSGKDRAAKRKAPHKRHWPWSCHLPCNGSSIDHCTGPDSRWAMSRHCVRWGRHKTHNDIAPFCQLSKWTTYSLRSLRVVLNHCMSDSVCVMLWTAIGRKESQRIVAKPSKSTAWRFQASRTRNYVVFPCLRWSHSIVDPQKVQRKLCKSGAFLEVVLCLCLLYLDGRSDLRSSFVISPLCITVILQRKLCRSRCTRQWQQPLPCATWSSSQRLQDLGQCM